MSDETPRDRSGGCLCGAVRFRVDGPMKQAIACHCGMCRRQNGNFHVFTAAWKDQMAIKGGDAVRWYCSGPESRRAFCAKCGSYLFFESEGDDKVSISLGCLDDDRGFRLAAHTHVADKGAAYEITDDVPQWPQGGDDVPMPPREG